MRMKTSLATFATVAVLAAGAVQANTISITTFDITEWTNTVAQMDRSVVEDFEALGPVTDTELGTGLGGELWGPLNTSVGIFTSIGGTGSGTTCAASGGECDDLSLFGPNQDGLNGQGNLVPDDGVWSLNADDTFGMEWNVQLAGGKLFDQVIFGIRDAADVRATVEISEGSQFATISNESNNNRKLVVIDFHTAQSSAFITIENLNGVTNDSFSVDGAAVGVVPLPAAGWMLLAGLSGLAAMRSRRKT
jgi:hypothetical protein